MPLPSIDPPLINSSNPWATSSNDLQTLFDSLFTGAVTTRTSLLEGFGHDDSIHQYTFFDPRDHSACPPNREDERVPTTFGGSLNTLGYSPIPLSVYLTMIERVVAESKLSETVRNSKPFILSVTGSPEGVVECYRKIQAVQSTMSNPLCMEINLSCPNIPNKPPPAYSKDSLIEYLQALIGERETRGGARIAVGIKTPPYTHHDQFKTLVDALLAVDTSECPIDFITSTNTLGSCVLIGAENGSPVLGSSSGAGIGGMAGAPLHPLSLGNVKTIRAMLDQHDELKHIDIIGIGGVSDREGFNRMQTVGARIVGIGTALGRDGISVFEKILQI